MIIGSISAKPNFGKLYDGLVDIFQEFSNSDEAEVLVGIVSEGDAAAYANVWEWGNARQTKKGPKTTRGINPDGSEVWLTITAPRGYIRVNFAKFWQVIDKEMAKIDFDSNSGRKVDKQIKNASKKIGDEIAAIIADNAPYDSGDLSESIKATTEIVELDADDEE